LCYTCIALRVNRQLGKDTTERLDCQALVGNFLWYLKELFSQRNDKHCLWVG